jgi:hypothetical protein
MVTCGPQHFFTVEQMSLLNLGPMPTGWVDIHYLPSQCKTRQHAATGVRALIRRDLLQGGEQRRGCCCRRPEKPVVTPLKDVAVDGDGAVEDGDGVDNFGGGGGGFNRSCCCVLIAQILGWRAIPSRAKLGDLSSAKSEKASRAEAERLSRARKSERSHAVQPSPAGAVEPSREAEPSRAGLPDRESFAAFPIQLGPKAARRTSEKVVAPLGTWVQ